MSQKQKSRLLSLLLRHRPEAYDLVLDPQGWVGVTELIEALAEHGQPTSIDELKELVVNNDKQRFTLSEDGLRIRAAQGHSLNVDLQLEPQSPPKVLYHGTVQKFLDNILSEGLKSKERLYVHLSSEVATATQVGSRRGKAIILRLDTTKMCSEGHEFLLSENGVWLTKHVPPEYLSLV